MEDSGVQELPIRSKPDLATAVRRLYEWNHQGTRSNFSSMLFDLFCKADDQNFMKLIQAFPEEGAALMLWRQAASEDAFFRQFGIEIPQPDSKQSSES